MRESGQSAHLRKGERRRVTVLFADLENSTELTRDMDPEEADELLSAVFGRFEDIVRAHEGSVEKYIGDAMVAVFGVPTIHEDDAERAVYCGIELLRELPSISGPSGEDLGLKMRIGVHSGLITTGTRGEFDVVTGSTMNVASRIQEAAASGELLISEDSAQLCSRDMELGPARRVRVKGVKEPLTLYPVSHGKQAIVRREEFVGREHLLGEIQRQYFLPPAGNFQGFLLTGEPGIGKTELVHQCIKAIEEQSTSPVELLFSRARKFRRQPYIVIVDFIANYFRVHPGMDEAEITKQLCNSPDKVNIGDRPAASRFARFYRDRSGITLRDQAFEILNGLLNELLQSMGRDSRVIMFIDNSDSMDRKSMDFLKFFFKQRTNSPMVILCEREPRAETDEIIPGLQHREIPPLTQEEGAKLLDILGTPDNPQLRELLLNQSKGNPLYLRSYAGHVERLGKEGRNTVTDEGIPDSIQNLFLSRIEGYNPDIRDLIIKLSVFSHFFSTIDAETVQRLTSGDPAIVPGALEFYISEDLLEEDRGIYYFRHDLIKRALYNSILNYNKRILHRIVADIMREQDHPHPVRLLHHLVHSREIRMAVEHAADSRTRAYNMEFVPYLEIMEKEIGKAPEFRLDILFMRARILFNNGFVTQADSIVKEMLGISIDEKTWLYGAVALHILTAYNIRSHRFEKGIFCGSRSLQYYRRCDDREFHLHRGLVANSRHHAQAAVLSLMIQSESKRGNWENAEALLGELAQAEHRIYQIQSEVQLSMYRGRYLYALELIEASPFHSGSVGDDMLKPTVPVLSFLSGKWDQLGAICDEMIASAQRDSVNRVAAYSYKAVYLWHLNPENPEIDTVMEQSSFRSSQSPNIFDRISNACLRAEVLLILGRLSEAEEEARSGLLLAQRHSTYHELFTLLVLLGEIHAARDDREGAAFFISDAMGMCGSFPSLRRRDRISCLYFSTLLHAGEEQGCSQDLGELCRLEEEQLVPDSGLKNLKRTRFFQEIYESLEEYPMGNENPDGQGIKS
nr:adenylate/guanylate cyclase domain-containing protein [Salinispira pacifica]